MVQPLNSDRLVIMAFMDSGSVVQFECDEFEIDRFPPDAPRAWEISGYRWVAHGDVKHRLVDLNVDRVEAIVEVRPEGGRDGIYSRTRNQNRSTDTEEIEGEGRAPGDSLQGNQDPYERVYGGRDAGSSGVFRGPDGIYRNEDEGWHLGSDPDEEIERVERRRGDRGSV